MTESADGAADLPVPPRPPALRITASVAVPFDEIEVRATTSGGPGGQQANRSHTRIEVRLDLETTTALTPHQRERVIGRVGPVLTAASSDERSQARNRDQALDRLAEKLRAALHVDLARRPTRPSKASVRRRLDAKKRTSERKADRRSPGEGE
jgi:ribosome-associated protein